MGWVSGQGVLRLKVFMIDTPIQDVLVDVSLVAA